MISIKTYINDFLGLFYPDLCNSCQKALIRGEECICTFCHYNLPRTNFQTDRDNPMARIFWGRAQIETATALLYFQKRGMVQKLVHNFKYKGKTAIGNYLGREMGISLKKSKIWEPLDVIVPVPLHEKKKFKRGFNQSEIFAWGISERLHIPVMNKNLTRDIFTSTQTRKGRYKRWENVETVFRVKNPEKLRSKNILLVDDVVTTGATLEACANALLKIKGSRVWIATIAMTS